MKLSPHKSALGPSVRVGILGGGQLAQMMAKAGAPGNFQCFILADKKTDCAIPVASGVVYNDKTVETLKKFCSDVDVVTIENEFVDLKWLEDGIGRTPLYPSIACLRQIQNKLDQKINLSKKKIPNLDFIPLNSKEDLKKISETFGEAFVIKAARLGYDGKGTFIFNNKNKFDGDAFWEKYSNSNSVFTGYAEPLVNFEKELAVIVARSSSGEVVCYPVIETHQEKGICRWATAPAVVSPDTALEAQKIARNVIEGFGGVGVFGVEMFLLPGNQIVINEVAPRVHNSGHLTMDGCQVGQFEMHLRAISGRPLEGEALQRPAMAMANIIGEKSVKAESVRFDLKSQDDLWPHWYGKSGETLGRKLGHINAAGETQQIALKKSMAALSQVPV